MEELGAEKLEQYIRDFAITESVSFDGLTSEEGDFDLTEAGILEVAWSGIGQYTDLVNPARFLTFLGLWPMTAWEVTPHVVEKIALGTRPPIPPLPGPPPGGSARPWQNAPGGNAGQRGK